MQTQAFQLTLYLPDDATQPAVALPKPDRPRVKDLSIREAAIQYLGELPDGPSAALRRGRADQTRPGPGAGDRG